MISLVTTFPFLEMILVSLVPFQNFGSLSRSDIISQTLSIVALISMDTSMTAIFIHDVFLNISLSLEIDFKPSYDVNACLSPMRILRN